MMRLPFWFKNTVACIVAASCALGCAVLHFGDELGMADNVSRTMVYACGASAVAAAIASLIYFPRLCAAGVVGVFDKEVRVLGRAVLVGVLIAGNMVMPVIGTVLGPIFFAMICLSNPFLSVVMLAGSAVAISLARFQRD